MADGVRCKARAKSTGDRCGKPAMIGQAVCHVHGGKSPKALRRVDREQTEAKARADLARLGDVKPIDNPLEELQRLAGEVVAWKDLLREKVSELTEWRYRSLTGEQLRSELALFQTALKSCESVLSTIARLNIDERLLRISDRQGAVLADVIRQLLDWLGLDAEHKSAARRVLAALLRAIDSGDVPDLPPRPDLYRVVEVERLVPVTPPPSLPRLAIEAGRSSDVVGPEPVVVDEAEPDKPAAARTSARAPGQTRIHVRMTSNGQ